MMLDTQSPEATGRGTQIWPIDVCAHVGRWGGGSEVAAAVPVTTMTSNSHSLEMCDRELVSISAFHQYQPMFAQGFQTIPTFFTRPDLDSLQS